MSELTAPLPLKEIGLADLNRVGIAPDAVGNPMVCFAGGHRQLALLAGLPGARRWVEYDCLAYPLNRTNILVTETIGRVEEATEEYTQARNMTLAAPRERYADFYPPTPPGEPEPLQHQIDAFCWACDAFDRGLKGFGQFSEQGTGKSRFACDLIRRFTGRATVVICQNSTVLQWKDWLERICPKYEIRMLTGIPVKQRVALIDEITEDRRLFTTPVIFVVNWEVIARLQDAFVRLKPELVIADEATRIKERKAQMSKAAHRIAEATRYRVAMTGTPLGNHPGDLWSIYKFLEPTLFGRSYWTYMNQYFLLGGFSGNDFVGFNPLQISSFIGRMYACAYRVTKATIQDMPEKNYETVRLTMTGEQRRLYDQIEKDLYAKLTQEDGTDKTLSVANVLVQITRLQQIAAGLFPTDNENGERARCIKIESVKTRWLKEYCADAIANTDSQIIVWCRFTDEIQAIKTALAEVGMQEGEQFAHIDGSVKTRDRRELQVRFNDREDDLRILVCQIQAVALGFDLPAADEMIYHTNSYSYLERAQSLERGHRMGRVRPYKIIDLICEKSIDVEILAALKKKQSLADMLLVEGFGSLSESGTSFA